MARQTIARGLSSLFGEGRAVTRIGPRLLVRGDLEGVEHLYVEGRLEGTVQAKGTAYVAVGGSVLGAVHAERVVIDGTVEGDVTGRESAHLRSSGRLLGDIHSPKAKVSDGSFFQGQIVQIVRPEDEPAT